MYFINCNFRINGVAWTHRRVKLLQVYLKVLLIRRRERGYTPYLIQKIITEALDALGLYKLRIVQCINIIVSKLKLLIFVF